MGDLVVELHGQRIARLAGDWRVVAQALQVVRDLARAEQPEDGASAGLQIIIESFADRLLCGEAAGRPVV